MTISDIYKVYCEFPHVSTDTRTISNGDIFIALKGPSFNANAFAEQALEKGASYCIIDDPQYHTNDRTILVEDGLTTLQELAKVHRSHINIPIIGITGTNGKTTTKELIACVLNQKYNTYATKGNLNNHIGVPLSLLEINSDHEMAVIEMGANKPGDIEELCAIAQPTHGIITNVGSAHLEGFGDFEGVLKTKTELYRFIDSNEGVVFVNIEDSNLMDACSHIERITYGLDRGQYPSSITSLSPFLTMKIDNIEFETKLYGQYNAINIAAAAAIGKYFDVSNDDICQALSQYTPDNNRTQFIEQGSNHIYLDAYNANPTSVSNALQFFAQINKGPKALILGDMLELGTHSTTEHNKVLEYIRQNEFNNVVLVGSHFKQLEDYYPNYIFLNNVDELKSYLTINPIQSSWIFIKGSRGIKLENALQAL